VLFLPDVSDSVFLTGTQCWLGDQVISLPDLRTEDPTVAQMLYDWISELVGNYSIDGIRVDSATNLNPEFLPGLNKAADSYCLGEASDGDASSACGYQQVLDGFLNFPM
jgi:alpha-amylase